MRALNCRAHRHRYRHHPFLALALASLVLAFPLVGIRAADSPPLRVRVATYNVENYVLAATDSRGAKTEASKAKVAAVLHAAHADIVALQELGGPAALEDIRTRTRALGLDYPHFAWVQGFDTNIQVGLLSRFPISAQRPHTNDTYLLGGRRFRVSRGILEAEIRIPPEYPLTVFTTHLKSRRTVAEADEAEMRLAEARILREKIDARLRLSPGANIVVLGDFNDTKDTPPIRTLIGRGRDALVDTRPSEDNGDTGFTPNPRWEPRTVTWTHYYGKEDSYSRIDYLLLHPNAAREWIAAESRLVVVPDWGLASDHRPVSLLLEARER